MPVTSEIFAKAVDLGSFPIRLAAPTATLSKKNLTFT
jgi:hypothetical protein